MSKTSIKNECPIPDTHSRLNQSFSLFQNVLDDYQDELRFTTVLNNLIQNLRNVTFVLQKELTHNPIFKDWYTKQQNEMKKDDFLKWLHDARTHVVHHGDLQKESYAMVRLKNNLDQEMSVMKLDPALSTEEIAKDFCKKTPLKIPDNLLEQIVIEVERVWIVNEYPKAEVIDILIYCFGFLTDLVFRAHEEVSGANPLVCKKNIYVVLDEDFRSVLHNQIRKGRITQIHYATGRIFKGGMEQMDRPSEEILQKTRDRYGDMKEILSLFNPSRIGIPFNNLRYHTELAKHFFSLDGGLIPMAFLYFPDKPPIQIMLGLDDPATKYLVFERLSEKVEETGCNAIVIVNEAWVGDMPKDGEEYVPAYIQQKKELIWVAAASPEKTQSYQVEIIRNVDGTTTFGKEEEIEGTIFALDRIYRIWDMNKKSNFSAK